MSPIYLECFGVFLKYCLLEYFGEMCLGGLIMSFWLFKFVFGSLVFYGFYKYVNDKYSPIWEKEMM